MSAGRKQGRIVLGVDPGLANSGWGVVEALGSRMRCLGYGYVSSTGDMELTTRLKKIYDEMINVIEKYSPSEAAVESVFFSANIRSAMATGQARGAILVALGSSGLSANEYSPLQIKQAIVGYGRAEKQQMQFLVKSLLSLESIPKPDHAADALGAAICHINLNAINRIGRVG